MHFYLKLHQLSMFYFESSRGFNLTAMFTHVSLVVKFQECVSMKSGKLLLLLSIHQKEVWFVK